MGLFDELKNYCDSDFYPFHMPGHKRSSKSGPLAEMYHYDITEIDGYDNLHQPESIIKDAQLRAARLFGSEETYFLINGSTGGILSAVSAIARRADKLIIARNCHKAVYHAAFLNHMRLYYVYPEICDEYDISGAVSIDSLKRTIVGILKESEVGKEKAGEVIAGVVITSPTYDGMISDIKSIASFVHDYGIPLIVDQAHGAHFGMHPGYPENAVKEGADVVIHSVHKTLPAPTQTALLHRNGKLVDGDSIRRYLRIYQSSSPSYLLMAGIDSAIKIAKEEGYQRLERLLSLRKAFLEEVGRCKYIKVCPFTEPGKLVISVKGSFMSGQMLYDILQEKYHLQMEMAAGNYVLAILSMMDRKEGFMRLSKALLEIDAEMVSRKLCLLRQKEGSFLDLNKEDTGNEGEEQFSQLALDGSFQPEVKLNIWEAYSASYREVALEEAGGYASAGFINLYPPGIPLVVPGEVINNQIIEAVRLYLKNGHIVQGVSENKIKVVASDRALPEGRIYEENKNYMYNRASQ